METIEVLRSLCEAAGCGGLPQAGEVAAQWLRPLCEELRVDPLGSVIGIRRCGRENAPLLLLEAHLDEIGLMVTAVDDGGFLKVAPCGGMDVRIMAAAEVIVWADLPLPGIVCSTPPHLADKAGEAREFKEMGIDVGLPAEEVRQRVPLGTRITFAPRFAQLNDTRVCSKALDDRCGCAAVLMAMSMLRDEENLPCDVAAVLAVQEEIGSRGAVVASFAAAPAAAIVTDVSFACTPDSDQAKCGTLGKGPMLGMAPTLNADMIGEIKKLAKDRGLPLQTEVMGGTTGTDADAVASSRGGVRTALLSIPQRYMHTPIEVVDTEDVLAVARLMAAYAKDGALK